MIKKKKKFKVSVSELYLIIADSAVISFSATAHMVWLAKPDTWHEGK